jgi:3-isopropylmalate dehydrogenase
MSNTLSSSPATALARKSWPKAEKVLAKVNERFGLGLSWSHELLGGCAIDAHGVPLPDQTLEAAKKGRCRVAGRRRRSEVGRHRAFHPSGARPAEDPFRTEPVRQPAPGHPVSATGLRFQLKPEIVAGLDILIVRELTGGIYFGQPRGVRTLENGERQGYNTDVYSESEIRRIAHVAFQLAMQRNKKVCSVDKANVLEVTELWKEITTEVGKEYPEVQLSHMYVDNAAMQLVRNPKQFDVIVTGNLFGDILSDEAAMLTGSIGMLPSASLDQQKKGMYEPCHGSAPDIAGKGIANPLATILSVAMMLRYTFNAGEAAKAIETAVGKVLDQGLRTPDIWTEGTQKVGNEGNGRSGCGGALN